MTNRLYCLALFACSLLVSHSVQAQEWTRFHGPNGQGVAATKSFPAQWSEDNVVFKSELPGIGHSSPVLWGEKVFLLSADPENAERYVLLSLIHI